MIHDRRRWAAVALERAPAARVFGTVAGGIASPQEEMMEPKSQTSPRPSARAIGVVYLLFFVSAFAAMAMTQGLVPSGDGAATANHILRHESWYRSGVALNLVSNMLYLALTALFYGLFEPVDRSISLLAAFFGVAGCGIQLFGGVLQAAPLFLLKDARFLGAVGIGQAQATALLSLKLYAQTFNVSLVVFAIYDLVIGYLVFRSGFLPRILGAVMMLAGVGWATFVWPPLAVSLSSFILPVGALAEVLLMLWLVVKGVNVSGWRESASGRQAAGA